VSELNILLLCNRPVRNADASTVTDHLDAFLNFSRHRVTQLSFIRHLPKALDLDRFDVVVIHYTVAIGYMIEHYLDQEARRRIREFSGLKVVFIQDEYRSVNAVLDTLDYMRIQLLFTCVPESEFEKVYPSSRLQGIVRKNTLTGYVPAALARMEVPRIAEREIDVGYRTRKPPFWLGELGYEKWMIADRFMEEAGGRGFALDISYREEDRIYGERWVRFVSNCKAMLGVESGASVFDFTGGLQKRVDAYVDEHPEATFHEVQQKFLLPHEGKVYLNQISPRCFEAAALRTAMILFEGEYSGILEPWRHYIPLRKDFSNIKEVLALLRDDERLQELVDRTHEEIAMNPAYSYEEFIRQFDDVVAAVFEEKVGEKVSSPYTRAGYGLAMLRSPRYVLKRVSTLVFQRILLGTALRRLMFRIWGKVPLGMRTSIRPLLRVIGR